MQSSFVYALDFFFHLPGSAGLYFRRIFQENISGEYNYLPTGLFHQKKKKRTRTRFCIGCFQLLYEHQSSRAVLWPFSSPSMSSPHALNHDSDHHKVLSSRPSSHSQDLIRDFFFFFRPLDFSTAC